VQDKFWVEGGTHKFEVYTVLADADVMKSATAAASSATANAAGTAAPGTAPSAAAEPSAVCCAPQAQTVTLK